MLYNIPHPAVASTPTSSRTQLPNLSITSSPYQAAVSSRSVIICTGSVVTPCVSADAPLHSNSPSQCTCSHSLCSPHGTVLAPHTRPAYSSSNADLPTSHPSSAPRTSASAGACAIVPSRTAATELPPPRCEALSDHQDTASSACTRPSTQPDMASGSSALTRPARREQVACPLHPGSFGRRPLRTQTYAIRVAPPQPRNSAVALPLLASEDAKSFACKRPSSPPAVASRSPALSRSAR